MMTIQALRRSRGITLTDLALLSGIPARTIAAIEHGLQQFDYQTREQLAHVFGVAPASLLPGAPPALQQELRRQLVAEARLVAPAVGLAIATAALLTPALQPPRSIAPQPVVQAAIEPPAAEIVAPVAPPAAARGLVERATAAQALAGWNETAPQPVERAAGASELAGGPKSALVAAVTTDGTPRGCPIATTGRVVVTQGYAVGTHAPAAAWGALDMAVDGDGDGYAEIATTRGVLVFTPHAGTVRVALNSWPAGNYVRVTNDTTGWATAYAHLDQVFVQNGQWLEAGTVIGTIGETGMTTGAHLHYEVWQRGVNVDPTPYVQCG